MFTQILHAKCFIYKPQFIKDRGTYEEIVNKYPDYKSSFIVSDNPITDLEVVSVPKPNKN
jgi:cell division protein FtsX